MANPFSLEGKNAFLNFFDWIGYYGKKLMSFIISVF